MTLLSKNCFYIYNFPNKLGFSILIRVSVTVPARAMFAPSSAGRWCGADDSAFRSRGIAETSVVVCCWLPSHVCESGTRMCNTASAFLQCLSLENCSCFFFFLHKICVTYYFKILENYTMQTVMLL